MRRATLAFLLLMLGASCVSMGRDFPTAPVRRIVVGTTTRDELLATFGEPYQRGLENGKESLTWYRVRYRGTSSVSSRELHVVLRDDGRVDSYSYSATEP